MYHLIKNWKIICSWDSEMSQAWSVCVEYDFSNEELENIKNWYNIEVSEQWEVSLSTNDQVTKNEIKEKLEKISKYEDEIIKCWWDLVWVEHIKIDAWKNAKINRLKNAIRILQWEIDRYEENLVDDVITAFFS